MYPVNRIDGFYPAEPEPPPRLSAGDRLLAKAWGCKIELIRFEGEDGESEVSCNVELKTEIEGEPADVLAAILAEFRQARGGEGTVAQ